MDLWTLGLTWHEEWLKNSKNLGTSPTELAEQSAFTALEGAFKKACKGKKVLIDFEKYLLYLTADQRRVNGRIIRYMLRFGAQITWLKEGKTTRDAFVLACIGANLAVNLDQGNIVEKTADIIVA